MTRPLRVAIVGCGKIADGHVEEIGKMPESAQLIAVCDRELLMAEQLAARYGVPVFTDDFAGLLHRERPEVVHITTPPQSHADLARAAIEAGCHVYVEKPFALDAEQTRQILEQAERAGRKVTVGYSSFFDPPALALREMVERGELGTPVHVESYYGYDLTGAFGKAMLGSPGHWVHGLPGKLFQNVIDHMLNKIVEFVPDEAPAVSAFASALRPRRYGDARDELMDELRVVVRGERVTGYGTFSSHIRPNQQFVRVYGTRATAHVDFLGRTVTVDTGNKLPSALGRLAPPFLQAGSLARAGACNIWRFLRSDFQYFAGLRTLMARFYESILRNTPAPIPARDIQRIARLMDEIFRQVREEKRA
jgi:predicted dehydrogenase